MSTTVNALSATQHYVLFAKPAIIYFERLAQDLQRWVKQGKPHDGAEEFRFVLTLNGNFGYAGSFTDYDETLEALVGGAVARFGEIGQPRPTIYVSVGPKYAWLFAYFNTGGAAVAPYFSGQLLSESGALVCYSSEQTPNTNAPLMPGPEIRMMMGQGG